MNISSDWVEHLQSCCLYFGSPSNAATVVVVVVAMDSDTSEEVPFGASFCAWKQQFGTVPPNR